MFELSRAKRDLCAAMKSPLETVYVGKWDRAVCVTNQYTISRCSQNTLSDGSASAAIRGKSYQTKWKPPRCLLGYLRGVVGGSIVCYD